MTLIGDPRIIFLDEPTTGLDPRSRHTMWQIAESSSAGGVTVFLTTQNLDEADQLADRIARPRPRPPGRRGHAQLSSSAASRVAASGSTSATADGGVAASVLGGVSRRRGARLEIPTDGTPQSLRTLLDRIDEHALSVESVTVETPDLDDVFFALTGAPHHTLEESA